MDFQNRAGSKPGSGGLLSDQQAGIDRRERLRKIAMENIDLNKDPYFMRNHLGSYECKLCMTMHPSEGNYLAHTQGKRHQTNLGRRAAREAKERGGVSELKKSVQVKKTIKIGRPGYKVIKQVDKETGKKGILFELVYPDIEKGVQPRHRMMSAYEQKIGPKSADYQYILFAAEPYETVGFRIPNEPLDKGEGKFSTDWNKDTNTFKLQLFFD
mmetsp:Transcript_6745/g.10674  ORF Transcript_6745/g.10674 Transcript_6745/m.10674 type:complete len:213 (+) Transcript_6745:20-658(+)